MRNETRIDAAVRDLEREATSFSAKESNKHDASGVLNAAHTLQRILQEHLDEAAG